MTRDTSTGQVLEQMILHALKKGGYEYEKQKCIGERLGGKNHKLDVLAYKNEQKFFISLKWQQSSGTAEQKIPFEILCLAKAVKEHGEKGMNVRAYLILGGPDENSWTLRDFFIKEGLNQYLHPDYTNLVKIVKTEKFIALANKADL